MPKLPASAPQSKKDSMMEERMGDFKSGKMHSGTGVKGGRIKSPVTDRKQAIAIALSESGQSKKSKRFSKRESKRR
jgi:hypothetical protein